MSYIPVFCISDKVTNALVAELQTSHEKGECTCFFPAATGLRKPEHEPKVQSVQDELDIFDEATSSDLQKIVEQLNEEAFAILDERSAQDKTVVISSVHAFLDDDEKVAGTSWIEWRVTFAEAMVMVTHLQFTMEIEDTVYMGRKDHFTGADGVFQAKEALAAQGLLG